MKGQFKMISVMEWQWFFFQLGRSMPVIFSTSQVHPPVSESEWKTQKVPSPHLIISLPSCLKYDDCHFNFEHLFQSIICSEWIMVLNKYFIYSMLKQPLIFSRNIRSESQKLKEYFENHWGHWINFSLR